MSKDLCPLCGNDMAGDPIPQEYIDKGYYAPGVTHYSRRMGHEIQGFYDGTAYWVDASGCGKAWPRDFGDWDAMNEGSRHLADQFNAAQDGAA